MTPQEGKAYFRSCCEELGLDCDRAVKLGAGDPKNDKTFVYKSDPHARKTSQLYAVKYFSTEDVYIAWNLREPYGKGKSGFSLQKKAVRNLRPGQVLAASKVVNDLKRSPENVFAFRPDAVKHFLEVYIKPHI